MSFPRTIRSFTVHRDIEEGVYEFHLRGTKVAAVPIFGTHVRTLDTIADDLHNIHFRTIKFLEAHPEATLAPAHEGTPETTVDCLEDLRS